MRDVAVTVLVIAGGALELLACLGVVLMRTALDRLHYTGLATLAALCLAAAIFVQESFSIIADKAIAIAVLLAIGSPVLTQATARAIHARGERDR
jgi:multisubunit Na+/H+ antiporter MnhG subunit